MVVLAGQQEGGPVEATGETTVTITTGPSPAPEQREAATRDDVIEVVVLLACRYPDGPTDVERRTFIVEQLAQRRLDQGSFDRELARATVWPLFEDQLANGMAEQCPDVLSDILSSPPPSNP